MTSSPSASRLPCRGRGQPVSAGPSAGSDVAMLQSLVRDGGVDEMTAGYGHVIVDECHHLPAVSFERVLAEVKARCVVGLTATPYRRDGQQPIVHMQCGPVRYMVDPRSDAVRRPFAHHLICRQTNFEAEAIDAEAHPGFVCCARR